LLDGLQTGAARAAARPRRAAASNIAQEMCISGNSGSRNSDEINRTTMTVRFFIQV
jgi:hypothetical protein